MNMAIIYWWWMLKVEAQNDLDLLNRRNLGMSSQIWAQSRRLRLTSVTGELPPISASSGLKGSGNDPSLFSACEGKQYANLWGLMCAVAGHSWGLTFTFLQTPSSLGGSVLRPSKLRASGNFSLICGPPEPPSGPWNEFISPQWDANDWCYNNITPCHNQLCILKREEMRRSVTFSVLSPAWKDNDFQHKCMKRSGSINTYCAQFFLTDFTRIFI